MSVIRALIFTVLTTAFVGWAAGWPTLTPAMSALTGLLVLIIFHLILVCDLLMVIRDRLGQPQTEIPAPQTTTTTGA
jgi:uncharacterized membrane protein YagU involved in acid resistance